MEKFLSEVIDIEIIRSSSKLLSNVDKSQIRALRSDLQRNNNLRQSINSRKISLKEVLSMSYEELADEETKRRREQIRKENIKQSIRVAPVYTKDEIDILINKIEDP